MSHIVLARKYRPQTFDAFVGQDLVLKALTGALEAKRIHQAYLFTGTRGVGKTTLARLLAKALNCTQGISVLPCGKCVPCESIAQGHFVDLIEVDAASRTKVEDTRSLLDNIQYLPVQGRYKIYLIDEVHMLSGHSFNALLKTLEEPPDYVKFLLATTEPDKLPMTILSRCLQFHLKPFTTEQLARYLETLLQQEGCQFESQAIHLIAKAAKGGVRDALSLLEQAISLCGDQIVTDAVEALLGLFDESHLVRLLEMIVGQQAEAALAQVNECCEAGIELSAILLQLLTLIHELTLCKMAPQASQRSDLNTLADQLSSEQLQWFAETVLKTQRDVDLLPDPKLGFEMMVLRLLSFQSATVTPSNVVLSKSQKKQAQPVQTLKKKSRAEPKKVKSSVLDWKKTLGQLQIRSPLAKQLVSQCTFMHEQAGQITLGLPLAHKPLKTKKAIDYIAKALSAHLGRSVKVTIEILEKKEDNKPVKTPKKTPSVKVDPNVQNLLETFDGRVES